MKVFVKSLQLNLTFNVFHTEVRMFFHCSNNNSNNIRSSQLFKHQQNSLTQINDSQQWCGEYFNFMWLHIKKSHGVMSDDSRSHSVSCHIASK